MKKVLMIITLMIFISTANAANWGRYSDWWKNAKISDIENELNSGKNINERNRSDINKSYEDMTVSSDGETPLMQASMHSKPDIVKFLIKNGADVNAKTKQDNTSVLMFASNEKVMKILINAGANVNHKDKVFATPLSKALHGGSLETIKTLIKAGANLNTIDAYSWGEPLYLNVGNNEDIDVIKYVLDKIKVDVNLLLIEASGWNDNPRVIELLLNMKASVNAIDKDGLTSLHQAAASGKDDTIKMLVKHGADLNARDFYGKTALHHAAKKGWRAKEKSVKAVETLVNLGANAKLKDKSNKTPFDYARRNEHFQGANILGKLNNLQYE